jgi:hypothetical protein
MTRRRNPFPRHRSPWTRSALIAGTTTYGISIITAALDGHADQVDQSPASAGLAASCYGATTPALFGMEKISYAGYRFPPEIIDQAIWLADQLQPHTPNAARDV